MSISNARAYVSIFHVDVHNGGQAIEQKCRASLNADGASTMGSFIWWMGSVRPAQHNDNNADDQ
jgi:hypothetical protein